MDSTNIDEIKQYLRIKSLMKMIENIGVIVIDSNMEVEVCIDFENPSGIYYAGQMLCGTVRITLTEEMTVRGVHLRFYGKGFCMWTVGSGIRRIGFSDEEVYLNEGSFLVGSTEGSVKLMPGTHTYNIQCNLPAELPTSAEVPYGHIRYMVDVTILNVQMRLSKEFQRRFTVIRPINLNDNPLLRQPVIQAINKVKFCTMFCCWFCIRMTPIKVSAEIPVAGYTPGQYINLQLHVTNKGRPKDYAFFVALAQRIDYYIRSDSCGCKVKNHKRDVQCITKKKEIFRISNTTHAETVRINLRVPPVPPTDQDSSSIVKITYYVKICTWITSCTGCCSGVREIIIPITIGTSPILDVVTSNSNGITSILDQPTASLLNSELHGPNNELPTYEVAMDVAGGDDGYRPKYPVFKRTTAYSSGD